MSLLKIRKRNLDKAYHRTFKYFAKHGRTKDCVDIVFRVAEFYATIQMRKMRNRMIIQNQYKPYSDDIQ